MNRKLIIFSHGMGLLKDNRGLKDNVINFEGTTRRHRTDGSVTIMPKSYWDERFSSDPIALYNDLANRTQLTLINALQDEIMDITNLQQVKYTRIINAEGNHDFSGKYREMLGKLVVREITNS